MKPIREIFFGWRVVGAAFVIAAFAWGAGFYGPPIFLDVLHADRGWPISLVSAAITAHFLFGALGVANIGRLHRRFGLAAATRAGALLTALGLMGWALAREPWQLFLATPFSGVGWAMTSAAALNAMVSPWFVRRRPAALGMAFNGASMGGVLFSPLWVFMISRLGFAWAALLVSLALVAAMVFLAGRYLRAGPAEMGLRPDGEAAHAARPGGAPGVEAPAFARPWTDRRFVTLAAAGMLGLFVQIGLVAHLYSVLVPTLGASGAGLTMGATTAFAMLGRVLLGKWMPPQADRRAIAAVNLAMQAVGTLVLLFGIGSTGWVLLGCALFGFGLGNVTSLPMLIAQSEFRAADVSRVVAMVSATGQAGYAFAPAVFGLLRDVRIADGWLPGAAPLMFAAATALQLGAAAMLLLGRRRVAG